MEAQELEEVLPIKVDVSEIDFSDDTEPAFLENLPIDLPDESGIDSLQNETTLKQEAYYNEVDSKEAQLGLILRSAYYQKITSPRWAKILSTQSWRASFLKWRYYAQIEDYVRASSEEVVRKKKNPQVEKMAILAKPIKTEPSAEEAPEDKNLATESTALIIAEPILKNTKETTEEETFDTDSVMMEEEVFDFSMSDLTLPDSIISEKELYPSLETKEEESQIDIPVIEDESLANVDQEKAIQESEPLAQELPLVEKPSETIAKSEPKKEETKTPTTDVVTTTEDRNEIEETKTNKPDQVIAPQEPTVSATVNYTDRRSMTEQFASMYGKLPNAVRGGSITDRFGFRRNAQARGLKSENYGIDISAPSSTAVTAVFPGTVLMAIRQAPYDYIVTLKHGDFTTAYYFLDKVNVQVGDKVTTGQRLGNLRQTSDLAPFHFEIWQNQERVNPEPWLAH